MKLSLRGPYLGNAGDVLMVQAIMERLGGRHAIGMSPSRVPYPPRARHGLYQLADVTHRSLIVDVLARFVLKRVRRPFGLMMPDRVNAVLDCSGYGYGDPWGIGELQKGVDDLHKWKERGATVILLPQAFGPFTVPGMHPLIRRMLQMSDLVFAREQISFDHLASTGASMDPVHIAPDFTGILGPLTDPLLSVAPGTVGIVPNSRMLDQTAPGVRDAYLPFLRDCIRHLTRRNIPVVLVVHEIGDAVLVERIAEESKGDVPIIRHDDPRVLKGVIGQCRALIASRTHAMISALSQGIPVLGTSWAHKYPALFEEYGCPQMLLDVRVSQPALDAALSGMLDDPARTDLVARIRERAARVRSQIEEMWQRVERAIAAPV